MSKFSNHQRLMNNGEQRIPSKEFHPWSMPKLTTTLRTTHRSLTTTNMSLLD